MSNFLAVDTSSRYLTVLAKKGGKIVLRHLPECAMQHSVLLMDEIDKALSEAELTPAECDFFAAVTGPGSFTGIRIGVSAIKGFALAAGKPLLGVTAFDLIAYNVSSPCFRVAIDANHCHYYVCGYVDGKPDGAPAYLGAEEVKAVKTPIFGFEDLPLPDYTRVDIKNCLYPAICAVEGNFSDDISALYVRKSQAEEARNGN